MPTGYTASVADGKVTDFRAFALSCARAMGACIMQRDDASDVLPAEQVPSDYHAKAMEKAEAELAELQAMSATDAAKRADAERTAQSQERTEYRNKKRRIESRYRAMLSDVEKWEPPTPEHYGLKNFMRDQINESIKFDCTDYSDKETPPETGEQWLSRQRAKAAKDVGYHRAEYAADVERTQGRNAWIRSLYESLPR